MHCCRNVSTLNCVSLIVDVCLNCVFLQEGLIELCIVDVCLNCVIQCVSFAGRSQRSADNPQASHSGESLSHSQREKGETARDRIYEEDIRERYMRKRRGDGQGQDV